MTPNYYEILGVNSSATAAEIRRAYRILARRYHPDVNPGQGSSDKFRMVSDAYQTLIDDDKRRLFDIELSGQLQKNKLKGYAATQSASARRSARDRFFEARLRDALKAQEAKAQAAKEEQARAAQAKPAAEAQKPAKAQKAGVYESIIEGGLGVFGRIHGLFSPGARSAAKTKAKSKGASSGLKLSIVEVSISIKEAILGLRKVVELSEPEGLRKISIKIPAGARNGSVIRMRRKDNVNEELVIVIKLAYHPFLSIQPKGLVVEVPISVKEAICGASIMVPSLEGPLQVTIPAGTQSGYELRLKERGIMSAEGVRGDLFLRLLVKVPTCVSAVGIQEKAVELDRYFESPVRSSIPGSLLEL